MDKQHKQVTAILGLIFTAFVIMMVYLIVCANLSEDKQPVRIEMSKPDTSPDTSFYGWLQYHQVRQRDSISRSHKRNVKEKITTCGFTEFVT